MFIEHLLHGHAAFTELHVEDDTKRVNKHIMYYHIEIIAFDKIKQGKKEHSHLEGNVNGYSKCPGSHRSFLCLSLKKIGD